MLITIICVIGTIYVYGVYPHLIRESKDYNLNNKIELQTVQVECYFREERIRRYIFVKPSLNRWFAIIFLPTAPKVNLTVQAVEIEGNDFNILILNKDDMNYYEMHREILNPYFIGTGNFSYKFEAPLTLMNKDEILGIVIERPYESDLNSTLKVILEVSINWITCNHLYRLL